MLGEAGGGEGEEGRRDPPASQYDSLVVGGSAERWKNPPASRHDSLVVVGAEIAVVQELEGRRKPTSESI
jgi:hypothetical protein